MSPPVGSEDWYEQNRGPAVIVAVGIMMGLSTIAFAARIVSRRIVGSSWDWSDTTLLLGYCLGIVINVCAIVGSIRGFGRHLAYVAGHTNFVDLLKINFTAQVAYLWSLTLIKISILLFYRRIFAVRKHQIAIKVVFVFVLLWWFIFFTLMLTKCKPVWFWWTNILSCGSFHAEFIACAAANSLIDILVLAIPVWGISGLGLQRKQKISVGALFLTGSVVVVASLVRLVYLVEFSMVDLTWKYIPAATWSLIEVNLAVVSACLPFMQPLLVRVLGALHLMTRQSSHNTNSTKMSRMPRSPTSRPSRKPRGDLDSISICKSIEDIETGLHGPPDNDSQTLVEAQAGTVTKEERRYTTISQDSEVPDSAIKVNTDIKMTFDNIRRASELRQSRAIRSMKSNDDVHRSSTRTSPTRQSIKSFVTSRSVKTFSSWERLS
ncbi:hypothetical protein IWX49DRAFT_504280 [Phyllosticta citricarpa]|uniref:Rhodopsin domain-containing protein n=2 Tax=Phyllosticta TaxID=121621 RepID=A0ABR1MEG3_9PEZI